MVETKKGSHMKRHQSGVALLEVVITALIMAVGLLGMAAMQLRSVQFNQAAYLRSQASFLAGDMAERMRLDRPNARDGRYDVAYEGQKQGDSLADSEVNDWKTLLSNTLPAGDGAIDCDDNVCRVSIRWKESASRDDNAWVEFFYDTRL